MSEYNPSPGVFYNMFEKKNRYSDINEQKVNTDWRSVKFQLPEPLIKQLRIRTQYDLLNISILLRSVVDGYLKDDPDLMVFVNKVKATYSKLRYKDKRKLAKILKKREELISDFALDEEKTKKMYDIMMEEKHDQMRRKV